MDVRQRTGRFYRCDETAATDAASGSGPHDQHLSDDTERGRARRHRGVRRRVILPEGLFANRKRWWCHRPDAMLGIFFDAWGGQPIEAVILWLVSAWGAVVSYEFIRHFLRRRAARD